MFRDPTAEGRKSDRTPARMGRAGRSEARRADSVRPRLMGTVTIKIPLITWRDGRPRFSPGPKHRAMGYAGEDLRHGRHGAWFDLDQAIAWSRARQAEIAAKEAALAAGAITQGKLANAARRARMEQQRRGLWTVGQLVEAFLDGPRCQGVDIVEGRKKRAALAANTVRAYRGSARLIERLDDGRVWLEAADAVTARALAGILDRVEIRHGLAQARALRAMLSVAWKQARKDGHVGTNPFADLEITMPVLEERLRPATIAEYLHLVAVADCLGWPDLGDAVVMGVWTGQRQNDRLAIAASALTDDGLVFSPSKKKRSREHLLVPLAAALAPRLEAAKTRRRDWKVEPVTLLACPSTKRAWKEDFYRKVYRVVRHAAATGEVERNEDGGLTKDAATILGRVDVAKAMGAAGLTPMPSIADLRDQDLRDTNVSWLGLAGADRYEIAGFTGHAFGKSDAVLKHYLAVPPEFARRGMVKLEAWFARERAALEERRAAR